jgi:hypothetical protein
MYGKKFTYKWQFKWVRVRVREHYSNIDKSFESVKYSIKTQLRKVVTEKYRNKFKEKLSSYSDESKLFLYSKLKSSIGLEKYFQSAI